MHRTDHHDLPTQDDVDDGAGHHGGGVQYYVASHVIHSGVDVDSPADNLCCTRDQLDKQLVAALTDILDRAVHIFDAPLELVDLGAVHDTAVACDNFTAAYNRWRADFDRVAHDVVDGGRPRLVVIHNDERTAELDECSVHLQLRPCHVCDIITGRPA